MPLVLQALLAAFPFAWGLGVMAAYLIAGREFGVLPAMTIPIALIAAVSFSLLPATKAATRRNVMVGGAVFFFIAMQAVI